VPYGLLTVDMKLALAKHVHGKTICDLGAGDLHRANDLLHLGARHIFAVEKDDLPNPNPDLITQVHSTFADLPQRATNHQLTEIATADVALISWPANYRPPGLIPLIHQNPTVIYLGSNFNGDACGFPELYEYLLLREVKAVVQHPRNSLIIYGAWLPNMAAWLNNEQPEPYRETLPEELAGIHSHHFKTPPPFHQGQPPFMPAMPPWAPHSHSAEPIRPTDHPEPKVS